MKLQIEDEVKILELMQKHYNYTTHKANLSAFHADYNVYKRLKKLQLLLAQI